MALNARTVTFLQRSMSPTGSAELITALNAQAGGSTTTALTDYTIREMGRTGLPLSVINDIKSWISGSTSSNQAVTVGTGADSTSNLSSTTGHDAKVIKGLAVGLNDFTQSAGDVITALGG